MQTIDGRRWVARRSGAISTPAFATLQALKVHIATFFAAPDDPIEPGPGGNDVPGPGEPIPEAHDG